ncbi:MAG: sulfite exporter TauE/SafE family protein [Verrucomicrobia bacterium]|nr:sulfite exporter TauE/SafE family protein [Verrucomicrobiota bacterium]MBU4430119.1 sulfite exporter TauE/SafE family protein [Verrucomicrobiota bacterium]MCG2680352.1 sulfite exporter TauE/SafE family protein [Kiritimatiellia bacterium]
MNMIDTNGMLPWVLGICAGLLAGLAKTGMPGIGIMAVPIMAMIFPAKVSVGALLPLLITADLFAVAWYRRHADWPRLFELFPCVIAGIIAGTLVLAQMSADYFKSFLGTLVLVLLALELARRRFGLTSVPHQRWFVILAGSLAGFATTVGNVAGPIMNIYLIAKGLEKQNFMGTIAWYFLIFNCVKVPIYAGLGLITAETLRFDVLMIPAVAAGALMGRWILGRISQKWFRTVVLVLASFAALRLILW